MEISNKRNQKLVTKIFIIFKIQFYKKDIYHILIYNNNQNIYYNNISYKNDPLNKYHNKHYIFYLRNNYLTVYLIYVYLKY